MHDELEDEVRELLASGNKIAAVKRYREETGVGLAEAKAAVEALEAGNSLADSVTSDDADLTYQVVSLLERGKKILAVKLYRDLTGVGLKDAKDAVERIGEQNGIPLTSGSGCLGVVLLIVGVVTAVSW